MFKFKLSYVYSQFLPTVMRVWHTVRTGTNCRSQQKLHRDVEYICDGLMDLSGIKSHASFFLTKLLKVQEENYKLKYERGEGEGKARAASPP